MLGIDACFPLTNFKSLAIGELGMSMANALLLRRRTVCFCFPDQISHGWRTPATFPTTEDFIKTTSGAFFNIPNGAIELNLNEALQGIDRQRTEYIDRGVGIF